jgi:peptide/nickel transport system permease protein
MLRFIAIRLVLAAFTVVAISIICFAVIQLPWRVHQGFDATFVTQYLVWAGGAVQGNFGWSREYRRPVTEVIGDRLALTAVVAACALALSWGIALPAGVYAAARQRSAIAHAVTLLGVLGLAVPHVLLALVVLYVGFAYLDTDFSGLFSPELYAAPWSWQKVGDLAKHLPVPAVILAMAPLAQLLRVLRANLLDELGRPYVATARARGVPEWRATLKYPVRVALNPLASTIGPATAEVVAGTMVVAFVLDLPTLGPVLLKALIAQDMFLAGTIVLIAGVMTVAGTLLSDLLLLWIDPRIRMGR